jgi:hypothetical protein
MFIDARASERTRAAPRENGTTLLDQQSLTSLVGGGGGMASGMFLSEEYPEDDRLCIIKIR